MKRYIQKYDRKELDFKILKWLPVDLIKLRQWYKELEVNYSSWKFTYGDNLHVWETQPDDPLGVTGHIIPHNTGYYTLCWNNDDEGPKPFEQGCAKVEYRDNDNDELNPRKCFNGYALELVKSFSFRSKKWLVTDQPPGFKLITHQDQPDKIRIHIPIYVDETSNWIIDGEEMFMEPGYAYIVNTTLPHSVENKGTKNRVHLYGKVWTDDVIKYLKENNARF
jgi:hypothetical protein